MTTILDFELVTCLTCGWVHVGVPKEYAVEQSSKFNEAFDAMSPEHREMYGNKKASYKDCDGCMRCGSFNFRPFEDGDCPAGVTLNPVIVTEGTLKNGTS